MIKYCIECENLKKIKARGLCSSCYERDREKVTSPTNVFKECLSCKEVKHIKYTTEGICSDCYHRKRDSEKRNTITGICNSCSKESYIKYVAYGICVPCYHRLRNLGNLPPKKVKITQAIEICPSPDEPTASLFAPCCNKNPRYKNDICVDCYDGVMLARKKTRHRRERRKANGFLNPTTETKDGNCESCGRFQAPLFLDHCHTTGITRGWLCHKCNTSIGFCADSPKILLALVAYLYKYHPELKILLNDVEYHPRDKQLSSSIEEDSS